MEPRTSPDDDRRTLLRPDDAARRLGLTARTLELWRRRGMGPRWVRLTCRVIRYPIDALEAWLGEQKGGGHEAEPPGVDEALLPDDPDRVRRARPRRP